MANNFDKYLDDLTKRGVKTIQGPYATKNGTVNISDKVAAAATRSLGVLQTERRKIDDNARHLTLPRGVKGEQALAQYFRQLAKDVTGQDLYGGFSDDRVIDEIRRMYSSNQWSDDAIDQVIQDGDAAALQSIQQVYVQQEKNIQITKANKELDVLKGPNGDISIDDRIQLSAAFASLRSNSTNGFVTPNPYQNIMSQKRNIATVAGEIEKNPVYANAAQRDMPMYN